MFVQHLHARALRLATPSPPGAIGLSARRIAVVAWTRRPKEGSLPVPARRRGPGPIGASEGLVTLDEVVAAETAVEAIVMVEEVEVVGLGATPAWPARPAPRSDPEPLSSRLDGSSPKATHLPKLS